MNIGSMRGVPLVASSPIRHDSPMPGMTSLDVHGYQPPWKSLAEYALHHTAGGMGPMGGPPPPHPHSHPHPHHGMPPHLMGGIGDGINPNAPQFQQIVNQVR